MQEPTVHELSKQPAVAIKWVDIVNLSGWPEVDEVLESVPQMMTTYGKIAVETADFITVCGTWSEVCEETYGDVNIIPRGCIKSITILSGS